MEDETIYKIVKKAVYISAFITLLLVALNLGLYRYTHSWIFLIFAAGWAVDGICELAADDIDLYNSIKDRMDK